MVPQDKDEISVIETRLHILISQSEGYWVAHCLDYDYCVQATTFDDLEYNLAEGLMALVIDDQENDREPLAAESRAPKEYWDRWGAARELRTHIPPRFDQREVHLEARVAPGST